MRVQEKKKVASVFVCSSVLCVPTIICTCGRSYERMKKKHRLEWNKSSRRVEWNKSLYRRRMVG